MCVCVYIYIHISNKHTPPHPQLLRLLHHITVNINTCSFVTVVFCYQKQTSCRVILNRLK